MFRKLLLKFILLNISIKFKFLSMRLLQTIYDQVITEKIETAPEKCQKLNLCKSIMKGNVMGSYKYAFMLAWAFICLALAVAKPGDLDLSFGTGGKVITEFGTESLGADSMAIQDGKILVAGAIETKIYLVRYHSNGTIDQTFATNGIDTIEVSNYTFCQIAIQSDQKILVAYNDDTSSRLQFGLARRLMNGGADPEFGTLGSMTVDFGVTAFFNALAVSGDRIFLGGISVSDRVIIACVKSNGYLDSSFGDGGKVSSNFGPQSSLHAMTVLPDGAILAAGTCLPAPYVHDFLLARYNSAGQLDTSFGNGGIVITDFEQDNQSFVNALMLLANGGILAAGNGTKTALAQYDSAGNLDNSFGVGGKAYSIAAWPSLALEEGGKFILGGFEYSPSDNYIFTIACHCANGGLDSGFGTNGIVQTRFFGASEQCNDVAVLPNGKILAIGRAYNPSTGRNVWAMAQYEGESVAVDDCTIQIGTLDPTHQYVIDLEFASAQSQVHVEVQWLYLENSRLRLDRIMPAPPRGEEESVETSRGAKVIDAIYKNVPAGRLYLMLSHQSGTLATARDVTITISQYTTLPKRIRVMPWFGKPADVSSGPFTHKVILPVSPTNFLSEYPTGAKITEEIIEMTGRWEWQVQDSSTSVLEYAGLLDVTLP